MYRCAMFCVCFLFARIKIKSKTLQNVSEIHYFSFQVIFSIEMIAFLKFFFNLSNDNDEYYVYSAKVDNQEMLL